MIQCVFKNLVYRSQRPGYPNWPPMKKDVDVWIKELHCLSVLSIICLVDAHELTAYKMLPGGLIRYYEKNKFEVCHVPIMSRQYVYLLSEEEVAVASAYKELPKPILIHGNEGMFRTEAALEVINGILMV